MSKSGSKSKFKNRRHPEGASVFYYWSWLIYLDFYRVMHSLLWNYLLGGKDGYQIMDINVITTLHP